MNTPPKSSPITWQKVAVVTIILLISGYRWYVDQQNQPVPQPQRPSVASKNSSAGTSTVAKSTSIHGSTDAEDSPYPPVVSTKNFLVSIGGQNLQSPAGLVYGVGSGGEHRVDHVMDHSHDNPQRPVQSVFNGDRQTILKLIDEAYVMVKSKSKNVETESSDGTQGNQHNTVYTVFMGRKIGYEGGEKGQRNGHPSLSRLRLVLDGNRVITAYPYR